MRAVVQRVLESRVFVDGVVVGEIGTGLLVLLGVAEGDTLQDIDYMAEKVANLRVFRDSGGKMNLSVLDISGSVLVVSQFTLLGDCRKGRRPSYFCAADPGLAEDFYEKFCCKLCEYGIPVAKGVFQAMMDVHLINDGPVTLLLDSKKVF